MKPAPFELVRVHDIAAAVDALAAGGEDARLLAGGQSLVPMMNLRLARPTCLVDVTPVTDLDRVAWSGGELWLGALVRHGVVERHELVRRHAPALAVAAAHVGHPAIRRRGTLGGSLAHADPAAELVAAATALDARVVLTSPRGVREVPVTELVVGPYTTVLEPDEVLTWVVVPGRPERRVGFHETTARDGDYAAVGAVVTRTGPEVGRLAVFGTVTGQVHHDLADGATLRDVVGRIASDLDLDAVDRHLLGDAVARAQEATT